MVIGVGSVVGNAWEIGPWRKVRLTTAGSVVIHSLENEEKN